MGFQPTTGASVTVGVCKCGTGTGVPRERTTIGSLGLQKSRLGENLPRHVCSLLMVWMVRLYSMILFKIAGFKFTLRKTVSLIILRKFSQF